MPSWMEFAADPRSTDELVEAALLELEADDDETGVVPWALAALQWRPTREVLERAIALSGSSNSDDRYLGVSILAKLQERQGPYRPAFVDESVETLIEQASVETDDAVFSRIVWALGKRQDPRALPLLLGCVDHEDEQIRFDVACSLPSCATPATEPEVAQALIKLTRDEDADVRDYALFGFPQLSIDTPEIRDATLACTSDEDWSAAGQALVNLAMLGDTRVLEPLTKYVAAGNYGAYGFEAAAAIADASLLLVLKAAHADAGYADDLKHAITACETGISRPAWGLPPP